MAAPTYGFIDWSPSSRVNKEIGLPSNEAFAQLQDCVAAYRDEWPLTVRGWLYRMMARHGWTKDAERPLKEFLGNGRRSGKIPWEAVTSRRGDCRRYWHSDPDGWAFDAVVSVDGFNLDLQAGQSRRIVLWCETEGYVPRFTALAHEYGCELRAGQGFDTLSAKYEFARQVSDSEPTVALHFGDLDGSGQAVARSLAADIGAFVASMTGSPDHFRQERIGLLDHHIDEYGIAFDPYTPAQRAKDAKSQHVFTGTRTAQAEALLPSQAVAIARAAIESHLDLDKLKAQRARQAEMRRTTKNILMDGWLDSDSETRSIILGDR